MPLPTNVVSEFVKITNDTKKQKTETTIEGTIEVEDNQSYVKLDGLMMSSVMGVLMGRKLVYRSVLVLQLPTLNRATE